MLRKSELIGAAWEAVDDKVLKVYGKGRKFRLVPIVDPGMWTFLNAYTNELRLPLHQRFHGALLRQRILLSEKLHSHIFRATGATLMAAAGMNSVSLSMPMGHASTGTTQRYYLDAKQMNLPDEVQKICLRIQEAFDSQRSSITSVHSPFGWYERKGYQH